MVVGFMIALIHFVDFVSGGAQVEHHAHPSYLYDAKLLIAGQFVNRRKLQTCAFPIILLQVAGNNIFTAGFTRSSFT